MKISVGRNGIELGEWPEEEVRNLYREGRLMDTDFYWTEGMTEWVPLLGLMRTAPPQPATPPAASPPSQPAPPLAEPAESESPLPPPEPVPMEERQTHFLLRGGARLIDLFLWALVTSCFLIPVSLIAGSVLSFDPTSYPAHQLEAQSWLLFLVLTLLGNISFVIGEIVWLSLVGTSPGKFIFGLKVRFADGGGFLPLKESFLRGFYLLVDFWFMLFFPLNAVACGIIQGRSFLKSGVTPWDRKSGTSVIRKPLDKTRFKIAVAFGILGSIGTLFYIKVTFLEAAFILHPQAPAASVAGLQPEATSGAENSSSAPADLTLSPQPAGPATVATDSAEAAAYRLSATAGDAVAARKLGLLYFRGRGVPKDLTEALKWLQQAANQGDAAAQYQVGNLYLNGQGVSQDFGQAFIWYKKAADQGDANAQNDVGSMYLTGQGVAKDYSQAFKWYQKAAEQGNAIAQCNLGGMYLKAQGVAKDYGKALSWYQKASDQGEGGAQYALGFMYENGLGVTKNRSTAEAWYRKAAAHGDMNAQKWLKHSGH